MKNLKSKVRLQRKCVITICLNLYNNGFLKEMIVFFMNTRIGSRLVETESDVAKMGIK